MQVSRNNEPPGTPGRWQLSPWAQRFEIHYNRSTFADFTDASRSSGILHSGLAPHLPWMHPRWYADDPRPLDDSVVIGDAEIDRLFLSEDYQDRLFGGDTKTWELATLMKYVNFGPRFGRISGGHNQGGMNPVANTVMINTNTLGVLVDEEVLGLRIWQMESVQVDESKWFPFFRRDRWYNNMAHVEWNVDDDIIWNARELPPNTLNIVSIRTVTRIKSLTPVMVVRPGIEVADRILKEAIADQHDALRTVLYGRIDYVENYYNMDPEPESRIVIMSISKEKQVAESFSQPFDGDEWLEYRPDDWSNRLQDLSDDVTWWINDPCQDGFEVPEYGCTIGSGGSLITSIAINAGLILPLVRDKDLTPSERSIITFRLAGTIIHELTHSLVGNRYNRDGIAERSYLEEEDRDYSRNPEPIFDFNNIPPETGEYMETHLFGGVMESNPLLTTIPLACYTHNGWPTCWISSLHASKLVSESFWTENTWAGRTVAKKSADFFHRGMIFRSPRNRRIEVNDGLTGTEPDYEDLVPDFYRRRELWDSWRAGWYLGASRAWKASQWGADPRFRFDVELFSVLFKKRDLISCAALSDKFIKSMPWHKPDEFRRELPRLGDEKPLFHWYKHAVGLLCRAALPFIDRDRQTPLTVWSEDRELGKAGRRNKDLGLPDNLKMFNHRRFTLDIKGGSGSGDGVKCKASVIYDPLRTGQQIAFAQINYCDVVGTIINQLRINQAVVDLQWLDSLIKLLDTIVQVRQNPDIFQSSMWLPTWTFSIPPYTSQPQWGRWNPFASRWDRLFLA
ncbi:hypothetical protein F5Y16DRAFT_396177 [Xylariaceae sp. FL0255]|nr:hypothetical protein F5Y16DRAFT_396177 [Xylariaceae sp. FL0255]